MLDVSKFFKYQTILDDKIKESKGSDYKERTLEKIKFSIIAEIIEFQEELEETHKTWKKKEFSRNKQLEEFVDIFFFVLQAMRVHESPRINYYSIAYASELKVNTILSVMIIDTISNKFDTLLESYLSIAKTMNFSIKEIEEEYMRKFDINMERVSNEWRTGKK
ncbi:MAG: dUTP diphosphatase [Fusobacteriaceae bacterium]